jgi:hypothetical protein
VRAGKPSHCFRPEDARLLSYLISENALPGSQPLVYSEDDPKIRRRLDELRSRLGKLGVLIASEKETRVHEGADFLLLATRKNVHVSSEGNRGARVSSEAIALRDGVTRRVVGSIIWRKNVPAPKWQMRATKRFDPLGRVKNGRVERRVLKNERNALSVELAFHPPLHPGELIAYGFYVWNSKHFAITRAEAEERYNDKWVREGLAVRDPIDELQITVEFPPGVGVQQAHLEKDPILTQDGPNVPGRILRRVIQQGRLLEATLYHPENGRYFLSWVPPE